MTYLFAYRPNFNSDLSKWDVSQVTQMVGMFRQSYGFDRTLCGGNWQSSPGGDNYLTSTGRLGCCDAGSYMSNPHLSPFSQATSCSPCSDPDVAAPNGVTSCGPSECDASGPIANEDSSDSSDRTCTETLPEGDSCTTKCNAGYIASNTTCTSGTLSTPLSAVCTATCATLTPAGGLLSSVCAGPAYTGALLGAADLTSCAGATCGAADAATCCEPSASCATLSASDASLSSVCVVPIYTGALVAVPATINCAGATCGAADAATCCERAEIVDFSEHEKGTLKKLLANLAQPNHHQADLLKVRYEKLACASVTGVPFCFSCLSSCSLINSSI